uniref:Uncharacterized protein n=1 Tax=Schizaphis graminum TaxID=13262 RepID=A0A2S2N980_SCHGA
MTTTTIAQEKQTVVRGIKTRRYTSPTNFFWGGGARDLRHIRIVRYLTRKFSPDRERQRRTYDGGGDDARGAATRTCDFTYSVGKIVFPHTVTSSSSSTSMQFPCAPLNWVYVLCIIIACVRAPNYAAASVYNMQKRFASTASTRSHVDDIAPSPPTLLPPSSWK